MPARARRRTAATAAAVAGILLTGLCLTGCTGTPDPAPAGAARPAAPSVAALPPVSTSVPVPEPTSPSTSMFASASGAAPATPPPVSSPVPSPPRPGAAAPGPGAASTPRVTAPPPAPTRLTAAASTRGGTLALVRGGAAQEFTVTLRNGNAAAYRHLLVAFQMEFLPGSPDDLPGSGPGFQLDRFDDTTGTWRPAEFRVANDAKPESLYPGGAPLARDAVRVERYRVRATPGGATGSSPLMVSFIDTDADRQVAAHVLLPHNTR